MPADLQATQRARILDLISEGQIAGLCDTSGNLLNFADRNKGILLDLTPIQNADGSIAAPGVNTDFRVGTANQQEITGFPSAESEVSVATQVTFSTPVQRSIVAGTHNSVRVAIQVPSLFKYDDKGARSGTSVQIKIELKRTAEATWNDVTGAANIIQGEAVYPYVRQHRVALYGVGPWDLKVTRLTPNTTDPTKLSNDTWWQSYTLVTDYKLAFRHSAVGAVEMDAKQNQSIRPRAYRVKGQLVRVPSNYNVTTRNYSGVWDGNFAGCAVTLTAAYTAFGTTLTVAALAAALPDNSPIKITSGGVTYEAYLNGARAAGATSLSISPIPVNLGIGAAGRAYELKFTTNPAWIWFDVATHRRYGVGNYVPEETIDKWGLYSIARYCDGVDANGTYVGVDNGAGGFEPRFACSVYIANASDAYKVLADLASAFRGMIFWGSGLIMAVQDSPKDPTFSFNNTNVIDGMFSYSGSARKSRHTVANVRWNDPTDHFKAKVHQEVGEDADISRLGWREASVSAFGCTSRGQAQRVGKWLLLTEKHEQETVSFRGGLEAARCRPGSILRIRDRNKTTNRMAGRVVALVRTPLITPSLNNGGMETAGTPLDGWTVFVTGTGAVTRDTTIFRSGVASAKFAVNGAANTAGIQRAGLTIGNSSTLGFWARCGAGTATCFARLNTTGAVTTYNLTTEWRFCTLTAAAGGTTFQIGSDSIGNIYVDDVELTDNTTAINAIKVDDPAVITTSYSMIVTRDDGTFADLPVTTPAGTHTILSVTGSLTGISVNAGWILRSPSLEPTLWRVLNCKELEKHIFEVSALKYVSSKFANVESGISLNVPRTSDLPGRGTPGTTTAITITETVIRNAEKTERRLNVSWAPVVGNNVRAYLVEMRNPGGTWFEHSETAAAAILPIVVNELGRYEIRVTALGFYENRGAPLEAFYDLTEMVVPTDPTALAAVGVDGGFKITWTDAQDGVYYRLYISATTTPPGTWTKIPGPASEHTTVGFPGGTVRYFWIQAVRERIDLAGSLVGPVSATAKQSTDEVTALINSIALDMSQLISATNQHANDLIREFVTRDNAIVTEQNTRASAISAETSNRNAADSTLQTNINTVSANLATETSTRVTQADALARDLAAMIAVFNDSVASLYQEFQVRVAQDSSHSSSITTLNANVGSLQSTVNILSAAYIVGGVAVATWGFKLDANGKVVAMQAIAASGGAQQETGVIVFSGADLRSDNYTQDGAGVPTLGWKNQYNGVIKAVAALLRDADIVGTLRVGSIIETGILTDAPFPTFTNPGSPNITVNAPSSPPSGYSVRYQVGTGNWLPASSFPFTVTMPNATTYLNLEAYASGKLASGIRSDSWNSLFL